MSESSCYIVLDILFILLTNQVFEPTVKEKALFMIQTLLDITILDFTIFIVTIIAYIILIADIRIHDGISQNFFTWLLWGVLDSILLVTAFKEKSADLPIIAGCVLGSFSTTISLWKKIEWTEDETRDLILVIITVIIWKFSHSDLIGLICAVISEIIAGIPLMKSSWKIPGSQLTLISYLTFIASYVLSIVNSPDLKVENLLFPVAFLIYSMADTYPLIKKWLINKR